MNDFRYVDPRWGEPGAVGLAKMENLYMVFAVVRSKVDGAEVVVLDTNDSTNTYHAGFVYWFLWDMHLWSASRLVTS